jgi:hypothetical protein
LQSEARGNELSYVLFRYGSAAWVNMGSSVTDPTNNYVEQVGLDGFSSWAIAEDNTSLPIGLASFAAEVIPNTNNVRVWWRTISETNNLGFYVQRSANDETNYVDLPNSFVPGHGTTIEPHDYEWTDRNVGAGVYYYRLKQVDLDGTTHFHEGFRVTVPTVAGIGESVPAAFFLSSNYPNPFNPHTTLEFTVEKRGPVFLTVYNVLGQSIAALFSGIAAPGERYRVTFAAERLPNGVYIARLEAEGRSHLQRMVLLK